MALIDDIPEPTDAQLQIYTAWWDGGEHPPTVTDQNPATWPALWTTPGVYSRSRSGRSRRHG